MGKEEVREKARQDGRGAIGRFVGRYVEDERFIDLITIYILWKY